MSSETFQMVLFIIYLRLNLIGIFVLLNDFERFGESLRIRSLSFFVLPVELQKHRHLIVAELIFI